MRCQASVAVTVSLNCQGPRSGTRCESTSPTLVPPPRSPPSSYRLPRYLSMRRGGLSPLDSALLSFSNRSIAPRDRWISTQVYFTSSYTVIDASSFCFYRAIRRGNTIIPLYIQKLGKICLHSRLCEGRNAVCVAINYNVICNTCQSVKDILSNGIRDAPPSINVTDHCFLIETYD